MVKRKQVKSTFLLTVAIVVVCVATVAVIAHVLVFTISCIKKTKPEILKKNDKTG